MGLVFSFPFAISFETLRSATVWDEENGPCSCPGWLCARTLSARFRYVFDTLSFGAVKTEEEGRFGRPKR